MCRIALQDLLGGMVFLKILFSLNYNSLLLRLAFQCDGISYKIGQQLWQYIEIV